MDVELVDGELIMNWLIVSKMNDYIVIRSLPAFESFFIFFI